MKPDFPFVNFRNSSRRGNFDVAVINVDVIYFRGGGEEGTYSASARFVRASNFFFLPSQWRGGGGEGAEKIKVAEERQSEAFRAPSSRLLKYRIIRNTNQNVYRSIAALILFIVEQFTILSKVFPPPSIKIIALKSNQRNFLAF